MKNKRVRIGIVGVDSGQLVVCDPCYINHDDEQKELNDYETLLKKRGIDDNRVKGKTEKYTQLNYDKGHEGLGVVFDTGLGDGVYEVYATIGETKWGERVKKVEVILLEE